MALETNFGNETKFANENTTGGRQTAQQNDLGYKRALGSNGFGKSSIYAMSTNAGSQYTNGFSEALDAVYKKALPVSERPKVTTIDKDIIGDLAYSSAIVSLEDDGAVNYYTILLEATGRAPLTMADTMNIYEQAMRNKTFDNSNYTTDDAVDDEMTKVIISNLVREYPNASEFNSVDGLIIPSVEQDAAVLAGQVASIAFNACRAQKAFFSGDATDLNITAAIESDPTQRLTVEANLLKNTIQDAVGAPVRADWVVSLQSVNTRQTSTSINLQNNNQLIAQTSGFIDAIPENIQLPTAPGAAPVTGLRFHPHIVVDSNDVFSPTPGYALLGLISSLVMTHEDMYIGALLPKDNDKRKNIGALNLIANLEGDASGAGAVLDLSQKAMKNEDAIEILRKMFSLAPLVSLDVEVFGPQTNYMSMFAAAAEPGISDNKIGAGNQIVETANWLTNGIFPDNFDINRIFTNDGIVYPLAKWSDRSGERDTRDVDLAYLATNGADQKTLQEWTLTSVPMEVSGIDPYTKRIEIISKLFPSAVITGKVARVSFTSEFIETLMNAAIKAGLNLSYTPIINRSEVHNLAVMGGYINNGGINNLGGFNTRQNVGQTYQTPYSNAFSGRYVH